MILIYFCTIKTDRKVFKHQPEKNHYSEHEQNCCRGRWYFRLKHGELS